MEIEGNKATTLICAVIGMDPTNLWYRACSVCERTLPENPNSQCSSCTRSNCLAPSSKRLFRILVSIATDTKVLNVICFDRAARILFGCSADDFFHFSKLHPFAAANAGKMLEGEMFRMTLIKAKNTSNAQHLRAVSILPLRSGFQPAIECIRKLYGVSSSS